MALSRRECEDTVGHLWKAHWSRSGWIYCQHCGKVIESGKGEEVRDERDYD